MSFSLIAKCDCPAGCDGMVYGLQRRCMGCLMHTAADAPCSERGPGAALLGGGVDDGLDGDADDDDDTYDGFDYDAGYGGGE